MSTSTLSEPFHAPPPQPPKQSASSTTRVSLPRMSQPAKTTPRNGDPNGKQPPRRSPEPGELLGSSPPRSPQSATYAEVVSGRPPVLTSGPPSPVIPQQQVDVFANHTGTVPTGGLTDRPGTAQAPSANGVLTSAPADPPAVPVATAPSPPVPTDLPYQADGGWMTVNRNKNKKRACITPPPQSLPPPGRRRRLDGPNTRSLGVGTRAMTARAGTNPIRDTTKRTPAPPYDTLLSPTPLPRYAERNPIPPQGPPSPTMMGRSPNFLEELVPAPAPEPAPALAPALALALAHAQVPPSLGTSESDRMDIDMAPADSLAESEGNAPSRVRLSPPSPVPSLNLPLQTPAGKEIFTFHFNASTSPITRGQAPLPSAPPPPVSPVVLMDYANCHGAYALPPPSHARQYEIHRPLAGPSRLANDFEALERISAEQHRMSAPSLPTSSIPSLSTLAPSSSSSSSSSPTKRAGATAAAAAAAIPAGHNPLTGKPSRVGGTSDHNPPSESLTGRHTEPTLQTFQLYPMMPAPPGGMPPVRFADPDGAIAGTDRAFLQSLRNDIDTDETIAFRIPMMEGAPPEHITRDVQNRVYQTVREVTGESRFWVVPPRPSGTPRDPVACAWFIRGLSHESNAVLTSISVISNPAVTMFISPLTVRPELVVSLGGFASNIGDQIESMIRDAIGGPGICAIIEQLVAINPLFSGIPYSTAIAYVLETLEVDIITLASGAIVANVYMQSPAVDFEGWRYLREAVAAIPFINSYNAPAVVRTYRCIICSGSDHPANACRFPTMHGWRGPHPPPEPTNTDPPPPGSALVYRPRQPNAPQQGPPKGRLTKGRPRGPGLPPTGGNPGPNGFGAGQGPAGGAGGVGMRPF